MDAKGNEENEHSTSKEISKEIKSNTWCDFCTYTLMLQCQFCKVMVMEKERIGAFSMCKCDNKVVLARTKAQEYLTGGSDTDAVLVHMKRTGCSKQCKVRSETIEMTLFQWQDMRQQFLSGEYLDEENSRSRA